MCNTSLHHPSFNGVVDPFSFSTFHLLRTCNRIILPSTDPVRSCCATTCQNNNHIVSPSRTNFSVIETKPSSELSPSNEVDVSKSPILDVLETVTLTGENIQITPSNSPRNLHEDLDSNEMVVRLGSGDPDALTTTANNGHNGLSMTNTSRAPSLKHPLTMAFSDINGTSQKSSSNKKIPVLPGFEFISPSPQLLPPVTEYSHPPLMELNRVGRGISLDVGVGGSGSMLPGFIHRRPRGEKRPIPDDQKDDKYYERRKRNNEAAKKSRDARKIREDRIAFRAVLLQQENSILRAQVIALRDELQTLRQLMSIAAAPAPRVVTAE